MKPTVGRVVHFLQAAPAPPLAAFVVAVHKDDSADLAVYFVRPHAERAEYKHCVKEGTKPGEWCWPPKV